MFNELPTFCVDQPSLVFNLSFNPCVVRHLFTLRWVSVGTVFDAWLLEGTVKSVPETETPPGTVTLPHARIGDLWAAHIHMHMEKVDAQPVGHIVIVVPLDGFR